MKTFIVLGNSGFIGSAFLKHLSFGHKKVVGVNRKTVDIVENGIVRAKPRKKLDLFLEIEPFLGEESVVINTIWGKNDRHNRNSFVHEEYELQEKSLIQQLSSSKISYVSFGSIAEIANEQISLSQDTRYADSKKRVFEQITNSHLKYLWIRIASCYGPRDKRNWLFPQLITSWQEGQELVLKKPSQKLNLCHIDSLVKGTLGLIRSKKIGPFNVATNQWLTVLQVKNCFETLKEPDYISHISGPFSPGDSETLMVYSPPISNYFKDLKRGYKS